MNLPSRAIAFACVLMIAASPPARAGDPSAPAGHVSLLGLKVEDRPMEVSVRVSGESSLVFALAEHYWIESVPHAKRAMALDGSGLTLQYCPSPTAPGSTSKVSIGVVPLVEAKGGELLADRLARAQAEFIGDLAEKYKRVKFKLLTESGKIKLVKTPVKADGKAVLAVISSVYNTTPASGSSAPGSVMSSACALLHVVGTETLVYAVVDSQAKGGTTVANVVAKLSVMKTADVNKKGNPRQLLDVSRDDAHPARSFPERRVVFEAPVGFSSVWEARESEGVVLAEERLDEKGAVSGSMRVDWRLPGEVDSLAQEGELQRKLLGLDASIKPRVLHLSTKGVDAVLFAYAARVDDRDRAAWTAVFRLDDQVWTITLHSLGDDVQAAADQAAFERMVKSIQVATRG